MHIGLVISSVLHGTLIFVTAMSLPFLAKKPIDIPPIVSVELIQIAEKTNIPFAPKAKKIIEKKKKKKLKEKEKKLVSEQAPPKKVKKSKTQTVVSVDDQKKKIDNQKPEAVPLPDKKPDIVETKKENKQNPDKLDKDLTPKSEHEKEDLFDSNKLERFLVDKKKEDRAIEKLKKNDKTTQDQDPSLVGNKLTATEEEALQAQIFHCWTPPWGMKYVPGDMLVSIQINLDPNGNIEEMEMLDHKKMNIPGKQKFKALAESVRRALLACQPLNVPSSGYERWKKIKFNFDASEMIEG